jgi:hypothetical protein
MKITISVLEKEASSFLKTTAPQVKWLPAIAVLCIQIFTVFIASQRYLGETQNINTISKPATGHDPEQVPFTLNPHISLRSTSSCSAMNLVVNMLNVKEAKIMKQLFYLTKLLRNFFLITSHFQAAGQLLIAILISDVQCIFSGATVFHEQEPYKSNVCGVSYFHHDRDNVGAIKWCRLDNDVLFPR